MLATAPLFRITAIDCFERPLRYRLPFRFGAATVTHGVQAFVRARIRLSDGREGEGGTAELMVPKWFDKDPALSNEANVDQLRMSLDDARAAYIGDSAARTAFGHSAAHLAECREVGLLRGLPPLASAFGPAEVDRAVLDALCRALNVSFFDAMRGNLPGFAPALVAPDLQGTDATQFMQSLQPQAAIEVRHTVGLADVLEGHPCEVGDGLPESLEEAIARYGVRWFKLKLGGEPNSDIERLASIARVLDRLPHYEVTLDGNEQFASVEAFVTLLHGLDRDPRLQRLRLAIAFIEQPLPRQRTFDVAVPKLASAPPLLIDEADAAIDAFPRARSCGYTGVSSKSCKGLYKSLVNRFRCDVWNAATADAPYFLSGEDLTAPAGLAMQQDLALASLLGLRHVERNGHHYIDGMASAPPQEQDAFLLAHPDLYENAHGTVRLAVRDGTLALQSLAAPGFASGAMPDWSSLTPLALPITCLAKMPG